MSEGRKPSKLAIAIISGVLTLTGIGATVAASAAPAVAASGSHAAPNTWFRG